MAHAGLVIVVAAACSNDTGIQTQFAATLNAAYEVPTDGSPGAGYATVTIGPGDGSINWMLNLTAAGIAGHHWIAAHIHGGIASAGAAGTNGPVRVTLCTTTTTPACPTATGQISGTFAKPANDSVSGITWETFIAGMRGLNTYVNVHSDTLPAGEIRGQVLLQAQ